MSSSYTPEETKEHDTYCMLVSALCTLLTLIVMLALGPISDGEGYIAIGVCVGTLILSHVLKVWRLFVVPPSDETRESAHTSDDVGGRMP